MSSRPGFEGAGKWRESEANSAFYGRGRDDFRGYSNERRGGGTRRDPSRSGRFEKDDFYGRGGRDRSSSWHRRDEGSWWCQECRTDNDPRDGRCRRCGARESRHGSSDRRERSPERSDRDREGRHGDDRRRDNSLGYGREDGRHDDKRRKTEKKSSGIHPCWPPPFENAGASYVFDSRSGFFYEGASDFFYDPKTKLYYGNKKRAYFQYCKGEEPPYRVVQGGADPSSMGVPASDASPPEVASPNAPPPNDGPRASSFPDSSANSNGAVKPEKKKIAISLKKKPLGSAKTPSDEKLNECEAQGVRKLEPDHTMTPRAQKQHVADMEKWSARGREIRDNEDVAVTGSLGPSAHADATQAGKISEATPAASPRKVAKTAKGEPICVLCKRKFASLEKLHQHEQVSALHKQNLAKKAAVEAKAAKKKDIAPENYRDRAKERRVLYGPDAPGNSHGVEDLPAVMGPSLEKVRTVIATEVVAPQENLGESNVGNKLLQKLGWKKGSSLGRKQESSMSAEGSKTTEAGNKLKQDWERIESLAGGSSHVGQ